MALIGMTGPIDRFFDQNVLFGGEILKPSPGSPGVRDKWFSENYFAKADRSQSVFELMMWESMDDEDRPFFTPILAAGKVVGLWDTSDEPRTSLIISPNFADRFVDTIDVSDSELLGLYNLTQHLARKYRLSDFPGIASDISSPNEARFYEWIFGLTGQTKIIEESGILIPLIHDYGIPCHGSYDEMIKRREKLDLIPHVA